VLCGCLLHAIRVIRLAYAPVHGRDRDRDREYGNAHGHAHAYGVAGAASALIAAGGHLIGWFLGRSRVRVPCDETHLRWLVDNQRLHGCARGASALVLAAVCDGGAHRLLHLCPTTVAESPLTCVRAGALAAGGFGFAAPNGPPADAGIYGPNADANVYDPNVDADADGYDPNVDADADGLDAAAGIGIPHADADADGLDAAAN
jgi:hypothetical protein